MRLSGRNQLNYFMFIQSTFNMLLYAHDSDSDSESRKMMLVSNFHGISFNYLSVLNSDIVDWSTHSMNSQFRLNWTDKQIDKQPNFYDGLHILARDRNRKHHRSYYIRNGKCGEILHNHVGMEKRRGKKQIKQQLRHIHVRVWHKSGKTRG